MKILITEHQYNILMNEIRRTTKPTPEMVREVLIVINARGTRKGDRLWLKRGPKSHWTIHDWTDWNYFVDIYREGGIYHDNEDL